MVLRRALALAITTAAAGACRTSDPPATEAPGRADRPGAGGDEHEAALAELRAFEDARRAATDFAHVPATGALGADPVRVAWLPGGGGAVGLLRGDDAVVRLRTDGSEAARAPAPPSPTALAIDASGVAWVGGTGSARVVALDAGLREVASVQLDGWTARALAVSDRWLFAADQRSGAIRAVAIDRRGGRVRLGARRAVGSCREPIQLALTERNLVVACLIDHAALLYPLAPAGAPAAGATPVRVVHDGPMWSVAAASDAERDVVVAGGVEDHPLERADGGFRYIDSFLYVYQVPAGAARAERLAAINLSAEGVVTPKWVSLSLSRAGATARAVGYGSPVAATVTWDRLAPGATPRIATRAFEPGVTDVAGGLAASPLLDAWVVVDEGGATRRVAAPVPAAAAARSYESRLGEALLFTTAMAPWNRSDDELSRFTCETCHFEAYGDGRVHFTGRGTVHAATKPLRGLFNNRPHFTRALDRTMTKMVHAEFRVANRWSGHDPWFALRARDVAWVPRDGAPGETLEPELLRRAFMSFLMDLNFETNAAVRGRDHWSVLERRGAELFRDRCESCHRARLVTEEAASEVPFDRWEELVLSPQGPIVWAGAEYHRTGIEPYVHELGARTTALRRVALKQPHFTSGSARTLDDVLERAGWDAADGRFLHGGAPAGARRLDAGERAALRAFLELL
ncbi:MAG TPA: hypothetical protein VMZ28_19505 [Kofleriaceae bacterium]|nr:hypothetical protein [Kofleriaceae bacterium]